MDLGQCKVGSYQQRGYASFVHFGVCLLFHCNTLLVSSCYDDDDDDDGQTALRPYDLNFVLITFSDAVQRPQN